MGKWVSIYLKDHEFAKLQKVLEREKSRGNNISAYKLVKAWIMERLNREDS